MIQCYGISRAVVTTFGAKISCRRVSMLHRCSLNTIHLRYFPPNLTYCISFLHQFHQSPIQPHQNHNDTVEIFDYLLNQCTSIKHCKQIQTHITVTGNNSIGFLAARLVSLYARLGHIIDAQKVFDNAILYCESNLLLWNSILRAHLSYGFYGNVIDLFFRMRKLGTFGDGFTFPLVIRACGLIGSFRLCRIVHAHVIEVSLCNHLHVGNELVGMYSKLGRMGDSRNVFDRMVVRSLVSWNMMISGYADNYDCEGAGKMFLLMELEGLEPNVVTWTSLISSHARCGRYEKAIELFGLMRKEGIGINAETVAVVLSVCDTLGAFDRSRVIHGYIVKGGLEEYVIVQNTLICVYGKQGDINDACRLFNEIKSKNAVTWNALITSHAEAGNLAEALTLFSQMERSNLRPNTVTWTALIGGFASKGRGEESLELFRQMQSAMVAANSVTIAGVLSVCAELAAVKLGMEIHSHVLRAWMGKNILVENGLVNMYTRCGYLKQGKLVFEKIKRKDEISWNSMITGYGMHGYGVNALETFNEMLKSGCRPDGVTFVSVLSACSHTGLVTEGRRIFHQMFTEYGVEPQMEHYACVVDLLGRAGLLQEASLIVKNMPMKPNVHVYSTLLNSCRIHKDTKLADELASDICRLNTENTGSYILLSNMYAATGRWKDSARVRASARTKGFKKNPGLSWIEVKNNVYTFKAGCTVEKRLEEVYGILEELALQMDSEGCMHDTCIIPSNVEDGEIAICV